MDAVSRGTFRTQLTKLVKAAQDYLAGPESQINDQSNLENIAEECCVYMQRITAVRENLRQANAALRASLKSEEMQRESDSIAEYEDKAVHLLSRLQSRLDRANFLLRKESMNTVSTRVPQQSYCKLPKLNLKSFSGNCIEWIPFWECFKSAVHELPHLSGAEKFNYLQHHLTGRAAESIAGFIPSEENYDAAISLLEEEYGNKEKLIDHTMQKLMAIAFVTNRRDVTALRKLYNEVTVNTRSLTALGVPASYYSIALKTILLKALPKDLVTDLHRSSDFSNIEISSEEREKENESTQDNVSSTFSHRSDCHLHKILKYLKVEVESLERTALSQPQSQTFVKRTSQNKIGSTAGLMTSNELNNHFCCFCKSVAHNSQNCDCELKLDERKELLKNEGRCFKCVKKGHNARKCRVNVKCKKCSNKHATSMCDPEYRKKFRQFNEVSQNMEVNRNATNLCSINCTAQTVFLQTLRAIVSFKKEKISFTIRMILDGGSQRTYVSESLVRKLNIHSYLEDIKLRILPFGSKQRTMPKVFKRVELTLKSIFSDKMLTIVAVVVPHICIDVLPVPDGNCDLLSGIELSDNTSYPIEENGLSILIGADHYWSIVTDTNKRLTSTFMASETIFGWTIQGPVPAYDAGCDAICASVFNDFEANQVDFRRFWDLETIGINSVSKVNNNIKPENFIRKRGERYECKLLWRAEDKKVRLTDNREGALSRLKVLTHKLSRNPHNFLTYDELMQEMLISGIAEKVPSDATSNKLFYLPHRPVYRFDKATTKIRIVFDASARTGNSLSLNDYLYQGPNLLPDILELLLNFRTGTIAMIADVEKAFLQIMMDEKDRDVLRFFWFRHRITDLNKLPPVEEFRMTRVTFGVACSPYLLCATLRKHFQDLVESFPDSCPILLKSFYMDDFLTSINDIQSAFKLVSDTCEIMRAAKMNIRKWNSNDERIRKLFPESNDLQPDQKVLGIRWCCKNDVLEVDLKQALQIKPLHATKRIVLSFLAHIYDPLGILGNLTISLKILLQDVWILKLDWDEPFPSELQTRFNKMIIGFEQFGKTSVPRCFFSVAEIKEVQLHIFADASPRAYGCVAYLRAGYPNGLNSVSFICSKSRVAPLKSKKIDDLTLPKLELMAALIASRLADYIVAKTKMSFSKSVLWSDSQITLAWINNIDKTKRLKPFIENRVDEIRKLTSSFIWNHCPGISNPADVLTREFNGKQKNLSFLHSGPEWLSQDSDNWLNNDNFSINYSNVFLSLQVESTVNSEPAIFPMEKFSRYLTVMRITAYIFRFVCFQRSRPTKEDLTVEEILKAENYWIKYEQAKYFPSDVKALKAQNKLPQSSSILLLRPFLDENGMMRLGSRLQEAGYSYDETYPILLSKSSYFSILLVRYIHISKAHSGVNLTLSELRMKYWIIKARQLVKGIIKQCVHCRKLRCAAASQPFAPLPRYRLHLSRPFDTTGIDFAGPLYGKITEKDAETSKFYIMILTCAVVRAVHLELVSNLSAKECLNALRRFFSRRGIPNKIISDNAKTFKRAAMDFRSLGVILESNVVQEFVCSRKIQWNFIVERAAWWGGFWERLIRIIKDNLKLAIGKAVLTGKELETFLCEAEAIVNSRPLTYVSDDPEDLSPLTPNHFLSVNVPLEFATQASFSKDNDLRKAWLLRCRTTNKFKKRFKLEYLHRLRSAHFQNSSTSSEIIIGDVVLVSDQLSPRTLWKLARVTNVFPGRDNLVRACEIKYSNGSITRRPIQHLYPLEFKCSHARREDVENINIENRQH